jgi:NitT/TauT family transport system substrate-binding protein
MPADTADATRRRLLTVTLAAALPAASGCSEPPPQVLRIGAHPWPGYEMFYLARARGLLPPRSVRLIETPSASASLRGLATGTLEAAGLTLDEVLGARARGLPLRVVAVLDVSKGADVVLARPGIERPDQLRGRRVGVEATATGAVMLDALLARHGLTAGDLRIVPLPIDEHEAAWRQGRVDAVVTYEPVKSRLTALGGQLLFSSAEVPGLIVDVLAVRESAETTHAPALRQALVAHFAALALWRQAAGAQAPLLAQRLGLPPAAVPAAFAELELPDVAANRDWLGPPGRLLEAARRLREIMMRAGLLREAVDVDTLASPRFLPGGGA